MPPFGKKDEPFYYKGTSTGGDHPDSLWFPHQYPPKVLRYGGVGSRQIPQSLIACDGFGLGWLSPMPPIPDVQRKQSGIKGQTSMSTRELLG